ncbi:MAG: hypothetical protein QHD01_36780 [Bradyrhizobium sp.]|uniref:hypothetical protein n=1 Tax=Bradyrhizobium sp. TaxID=376 RepID=UPI0029BB55BB|nr:hypothetical protein [Bradyrhizobium sp.]MDX3972129.1 hypothetical protein [Bradyrhizobium sp.]
MIDIYRIRFPKERLREMTTEERSLFFLLGYAANQIAIFKKLTVFATNVTTGSDVRATVEGAQSQILVRHLVGVVAEGWELIDKRFLNKPIGKEYRASRLGPIGLAAIATLQKQFGSSNILNNVRNQYAFHHPYNSEIDTAFATASANPEFDNEWNWYLAKENINCFYFISDMVVVHGLLKAIGENDFVEAQKKMHQQLSLASDAIIKFAQAFFDALLAKYFSPEIIAEVVEKVSDAPVAFDVALPFYVEPPDESFLTPEGTLKPPGSDVSG